MGDEGGDGWVFITGITYTEFVALQDTYLLFIFKQYGNRPFSQRIKRCAIYNQAQVLRLAITHLLG